MQTLKQRFRRYILKVDPYQKLRELLTDLKKLKAELETCKNNPEPMLAIVYFFDEVSKWHDKGSLTDIIREFQSVNFNGRHDEVIEALSNLRLRFANTGRDKGGWNRTEPSETVTSDDVWVGHEYYGLNTLQVSEWYQCRNKKIGHPHLPSSMTFGDFINQQVSYFMLSHIDAMIDLIDRLEELSS